MWQILRWSATATLTGLAGLIVGGLASPESNLLGGFALAFAPIYWFGLFGVGASALMIVAAVITKTWRRIATLM
jgi:hypothetical protein